MIKHYRVLEDYGFAVSANNLKYFESLDEVYGSFLSVQDIKKKLFSLELGDFAKPQSEGCFSHNGIICGKDFLYYENSYHLFFKWKVAIFFREGEALKIAYDQEPFVGQPLFSSILEPLIAILLAQAGYVSLHSLAFEYKHKGYLLAVPAQAGKTRLALILKKFGAEILADERNILGPEGKLFSYPLKVPLRINYFRDANLERKISLRNKMRLFISEFLNLMIPGGRMICSSRVSLEDLFKGARKTVDCDYFYVIIPRSCSEQNLIESISLPETFSLAIEMEKNLLAMYQFKDFLTAFDLSGKSVISGNFWLNFEKSLLNNLNKAKSFTLSYNPRCSDEEIATIAKKIIANE